MKEKNRYKQIFCGAISLALIGVQTVALGAGVTKEIQPMSTTSQPPQTINAPVDTTSSANLENSVCAPSVAAPSQNSSSILPQLPASKRSVSPVVGDSAGSSNTVGQLNLAATTGLQGDGIGLSVSPKTGSVALTYPICNIATDRNTGTTLNLNLNYGGGVDVYLGSNNDNSSTQANSEWYLNLPYFIDQENGQSEDNNWQLNANGAMYTTVGSTSPKECSGNIPFQFTKDEGQNFNFTYNGSNDTFTYTSKSGDTFTLGSGPCHIGDYSQVYRVQTMTDSRGHILTFHYDSDGELMSISDDDGTTLFEVNYGSSPPSEDDMTTQATFEVIDPMSTNGNTLDNRMTVYFSYQTCADTQSDGEDAKAPIVSSIVNSVTNETTTFGYYDDRFDPFSYGTSHTEQDQLVLDEITQPSGAVVGLSYENLYGYYYLTKGNITSGIQQTWAPACDSVMTYLNSSDTTQANIDNDVTTNAYNVVQYGYGAGSYNGYTTDSSGTPTGHSPDNNYMCNEQKIKFNTNNATEDISYDPYINNFPTTNNYQYSTWENYVVNGYPHRIVNTYNADGSLISETDNEYVATSSGASLVAIAQLSNTYQDNLSTAQSYSQLTPYYQMPWSSTSAIYENCGILDMGSSSFSLTTKYTYDNADNLTSVTAPSGVETSYSYLPASSSVSGFETLPTQITQYNSNYPESNTDAIIKNMSYGKDTVNGSTFNYPQTETTNVYLTGVNSSWSTPTSMTKTTYSLASGSSCIAGSVDSYTTQANYNGTGAPAGIDQDVSSTTNTLSATMITSGGSQVLETQMFTSGSSTAGNATCSSAKSLSSYTGYTLQDTDVSGNVTSYQYDDLGRVISTSALKNGSTTALVSSSTYGVYSTSDTDSNGDEVEYDTSSAPSGYQTEEEYDCLGRPIASFDRESSTNPYIEQSSCIYNSDGSIAEQDDYSPQSGSSQIYTGKTTYAYDDEGDLIATESPIGIISGSLDYDINRCRVSYTLDATGSLVGTVDVEQYSKAGLLTDSYAISASSLPNMTADLKTACTTDTATNGGGVGPGFYAALSSSGALKTILSDVETAISSKSYLSDTNTQYDYDIRPKTVTTNYYDDTNTLQSAIETYTYLPQESEIQVVDAEGNTHTSVYNFLDQLVAQTVKTTKGATVTIEKVTHDGIGNVMSSTNIDGNATTFGYYPDTYLPQYVSYADGKGIYDNYDSGGDIISVYDYPNKQETGELTSYKYNSLDQLSSTTNTSYGPKSDETSVPVQDSTTTTVANSYYPDGSLKTEQYTSNETDNGSGQVVNYGFVYDNAGRLSQRTDSLGETENYTYTAGLLSQISMTNQESSSTPASTSKLNFSYYSANGLAESVTNTDGNDVKYDYYPTTEQLKSVMDKDGVSTYSQVNYNYYGNEQIAEKVISDPSIGLASQLLSGGISASHYSYYPTTGQLSSVIYDGSGSSTCATVYPKDSNGNMITEQDYSYDTLGDITSQVVKTNNGTSTLTYNYTNSNDPMQLMSLNSSNTAQSFSSIKYDDEGNMLQDWNGNSYTYNALDEMTSTTNAKNTEMLYGYDGEGNTSVVYSPTSNNAAYSFYAGGLSDKLAIGANNAVTNTMIYTPYGYLQTGSGGSYGYVDQFADGQGNVFSSEVSDPSQPGQGTTEFNVYTAYGAESTYESTNGSEDLDSADSLSFLGEEKDSNTGYAMLGEGVREYDPTIGRFIQYDSDSPDGDGGINGYSYCYGDPVNSSDPSGHASFSQDVENVFTGGTGNMVENQFEDQNNTNEEIINDVTNDVIEPVWEPQAKFVTDNDDPYGLGIHYTPAQQRNFGWGMYDSFTGSNSNPDKSKHDGCQNAYMDGFYCGLALQALLLFCGLGECDTADGEGLAMDSSRLDNVDPGDGGGPGDAGSGANSSNNDGGVNNGGQQDSPAWAEQYYAPGPDVQGGAQGYQADMANRPWMENAENDLPGGARRFRGSWGRLETIPEENEDGITQLNHDSDPFSEVHGRFSSSEYRELHPRLLKGFKFGDGDPSTLSTERMGELYSKLSKSFGAELEENEYYEPENIPDGPTYRLGENSDFSMEVVREGSGSRSMVCEPPSSLELINNGLDAYNGDLDMDAGGDLVLEY